MKFFLDTADVADIKELPPTGLVDGVTTNPSLIAKSGRHDRGGHRRNLRHRRGPGVRRGRRPPISTA